MKTAPVENSRSVASAHGRSAFMTQAVAFGLFFYDMAGLRSRRGSYGLHSSP
jgi:hypothetical protein